MARLNSRHEVVATLETFRPSSSWGPALAEPVQVRVVPQRAGAKTVIDRNGREVVATGAYLVSPDALPDVVAAFTLGSQLTVSGVSALIVEAIPRTSRGRMVALSVTVV